MKTNPTPGRIFIYMRQSKGIDDQPNSIAWQRAEAMKKIKAIKDDPKHPWHNHTFAGEGQAEFIDIDVSANSVAFFDRPSGRILQNMVKPGDAVIFARFHRAWRSMHDFLNTSKWLDDHGVFWCVADRNELDTGSPIGKFVTLILAAVAELESDNISERTKLGLEVRKAQGFAFIHNPPLGYRLVDGRHGKNRNGQPYKICVPCMESRKRVRKVWELHLEGLSAAKIAEHMKRYWTPGWTAKRQSGADVVWKEDLAEKYIRKCKEWGWETGPWKFPVKKWQLTGRQEDKQEKLLVWVDDPEEGSLGQSA